MVKIVDNEYYTCKGTDLAVFIVKIHEQNKEFTDVTLIPFYKNDWDFTYGSDRYKIKQDRINQWEEYYG